MNNRRRFVRPMNFDSCNKWCHLGKSTGQQTCASVPQPVIDAIEGDQIFAAYGGVAGAIVGAGRSRLARTLGQISARSLPDFVTDVREIWIRKKARFRSFAEYIDSGGADDIRGNCGRYRVVDAARIDDDQLFDWGASKPFSLAATGRANARPDHSTFKTDRGRTRAMSFS